MRLDKQNQDFLKEKTSAAQGLLFAQGACIRLENPMEHAMHTYKNRRGITTVNNHLPFVWRVNYLHEAPPPELPEIAHEKARQILQKNLSRTGHWQRS